MPSAARSALRDYAEAIAMAVLLAFFIRSFIFQAFKIPSGSMLPTLKIGDHLLVNKFIYGLRLPIVGTKIVTFTSPKRGDVVVFIPPHDRGKDYIKRVQAVGGDLIEVRNKVLYLNGAVADDPHAYFSDFSHRSGRRPRDNFGPFLVPEGHVFVMGDNRDFSNDSRFWGPVPIEDIVGKAFVLYWSWDAERFRPRWSRIGDSIP